MATDLEKLVVQLSADIKGFDKELAKAVGVSNKQFNAVERRARQMNKNLDGIFAKSFKGLTAPLAGVGAALGVNELRKMTDTWTDMNSRITLATGSQEKGTEVMGRLGEMARRTYSDLTLTAESYLANATALKELGYSTDQSLDYTESLNNALVVSGAKGEKAARVQDALAKAMGLGKLSGDNLNTVLASGGRVAEALAAGLGTTVGGLRKLGSEGKITGKALVNALSSQMEILRKEAADMPATIGDGFTLLNNALLQYVGNADSATGISAKISEALVIIADNFDKVADAGLQVAAVFAAGLLGRSIGTMLLGLGKGTTALKAFTGALMAARTMGGVAASIGGIGAAAGPVGAIIGGAVVASILLYNATLGKADEASELYARALKKVREQAEETAGGIAEANESMDAGVLQNLTKAVDLSAEEIARINQKIIDDFDNMLRSVDRSVIDPIEIDKVEKLRDEFANGSKTAQQLADGMNAIARSNPDWVAFSNHVKGLAGQLFNAAGAAKMLNDQLAIASSGVAPNTINAQRDYQRIRNEAKDNEAAAAAFLAAQSKRASLTKDQLALETEATRLRNEAVKDGIHLSEQQIQAQARINIAGNESRSGEGKKPKKEKKEKDSDYERLTKSITDRTAAMIAETEAQRGINPLINDYEYAIEKARATQELLNAAQKAGIEITPEMRKEIAATAEQWALATVETNKLAEAQDRIRQNAEEMAEFQKDLTRGIVDGFIQGKKAADIFADALSKIGNKLLDLAFNGLFDIKGGGGGFGAIGKIFGFADGGYTGDGGKNQPAGVVHKGEVVWSKKDVAKSGGVAAVEAMRRGAKGYSNGGAVGMPMLKAPTMPILKAPSGQGGSVSAPVHITIDATGADAAGLARVQQQLASLKASIPSQVVQSVRKAQKSNVRL